MALLMWTLAPFELDAAERSLPVSRRKSFQLRSSLDNRSTVRFLHSVLNVVSFVLREKGTATCKIVFWSSLLERSNHDAVQNALIATH